jgi:aconitase A
VYAKGRTKQTSFEVIARLDNQVEVEYYREGGVLPYVFGKLAPS